MPSNPAHYGSLKYTDFSEEETSFQFYFGAITVGSIVAFLTQFGAFRTATNNIVLGTLAEDMWVGDKTAYSNAAPTDPNAQRERKWKVNYEGTTTFSQYNFTIGTADLGLTDVLLPGTDEADLTQTDIAAWITAFEALCRTPYGEAVNVLDIVAVGRNT